MNKIEILEKAFSPWESLAFFEDEIRESLTSSGAHANFIGKMRHFNEGDDVVSLTLEHYPQMTFRHIENIVQDACERWPLQHVLILHRVGDITPGDNIVLVGTWSSHRKEAFESCRYLMETLKSSVPFWKKETLLDGSQRWVERNTSGY